jgi:hypothetical protein
MVCARITVGCPVVSTAAWTGLVLGFVSLYLVQAVVGRAVGAVRLSSDVGLVGGPAAVGLLVDAAGRVWVPGSTLAGSLRAHLRAVDERQGTSLETALMGSRPPTNKGDTLTASPLWLLGTRFVPETQEVETEVVGQTAIDRVRGAAAVNSLRLSRTVSSTCARGTQNRNSFARKSTKRSQVLLACK